jgi:signal transduction histidine kinase
LDLETATSNARRAAAEAAEARSAFDPVSADPSTAHEETEAAWAETTALTMRMDEQLQRAAHAKAKVFELSQRIHEPEFRPDLTPALEDARSAVEAAKSDQKDRDAQVAEARNQLVAARTALQGADGRVEALEASVAKLRSEKQAFESGVSEASTLAGQHESRAEQATALAEELRTAVERAEARAEELAEELEAAVTAELEAARAGDASTPSDPASAHRELANVRRELEQTLASADELARSNEELREQAAAQALGSEAEAADARARLLEAQASLARLQDAVERGVEGQLAAPQISPSAATEAVGSLARRQALAVRDLRAGASALVHQQSREDGRLLQQLMTQARRMEHAIGDILDADQLTRGEPVLQRRSTEIDTLVRRVVREFPFAGDRALEVAVETATIQVDPARVERLIDDLLTSAVARTGTGDKIVLRLERTPDGVLISVEDGKPPEGDEAAGAAATFLAKLHGGWARVETLPDGTGVVRAFIPNVRSVPKQGDAQAEAAAALD